jgi:hypothetical protein
VSWSGGLTIVRFGPAPGDFDGDGDVDGGTGSPGDLEAFQACVTGPGIAYDPSNLPAGCELSPVNGFLPADFDRDGDVDQDDFGIFQRCYSGANKPAGLSCAD